MGKGVGRHNIHAEVGGADTKKHSRIWKGFLTNHKYSPTFIANSKMFIKKKLICVSRVGDLDVT